MIPTTHEEALVDLAIACAEGADGFAACAERAQLPALKAALRARSEQCRHALDVMRAVCGDVEASAPASLHALGGSDARVFAQYEAIEGHVLSAFRDAIEQGLPRQLSAALLAQFEVALNQYMQLVSLRTRLASVTTSTATTAASAVAPALAEGAPQSPLPVAA
jgi:hypothetical protein